MKRLHITLISCALIGTISIAQEKEFPIKRAIRIMKEQKAARKSQAQIPVAPPIQPAITKAPPATKINQALLTQLQQAVGSGIITTVQEVLRKIPTTELQNYLQEKDGGGNPLLHKAAQLGRIDIITLLLLNGAQTFHTNLVGKTPLHVAATKETVQTLLNFGASPFAIDPQGNTPLHLFVGQPQIIQTLLDFGANPAAQNKKGNVPIIEAIENKKLETVKILAKNKSSLNIANLQGFTAKTSATDPAIKRIVDPPPPPKKIPVKVGGAV